MWANGWELKKTQTWTVNCFCSQGAFSREWDKAVCVFFLSFAQQLSEWLSSTLVQTEKHIIITFFLLSGLILVVQMIPWFFRKNSSLSLGTPASSHSLETCLLDWLSIGLRCECEHNRLSLSLCISPVTKIEIELNNRINRSISYPSTAAVSRRCFVDFSW